MSTLPTGTNFARILKGLKDTFTELKYVYPPYWHEFREASSDCVTAWDNPCSGETIWLLWLGWVS
jgi:hypothetical protein